MTFPADYAVRRDNSDHAPGTPITISLSPTGLRGVQHHDRRGRPEEAGGETE